MPKNICSLLLTSKARYRERSFDPVGGSKGASWSRLLRNITSEIHLANAGQPPILQNFRGGIQAVMQREAQELDDLGCEDLARAVQERACLSLSWLNV